MKRMIVILFLFGFNITVIGQDTKGEVKLEGKIIKIDVTTLTFSQPLSLLGLTKVTDTLVFTFPDENFISTSILFIDSVKNDVKIKHRIAFNCLTDTDSTTKILLSDIKNNALKIIIKNGSLLSVGGRMIVPQKPLFTLKGGVDIKIVKEDTAKHIAETQSIGLDAKNVKQTIIQIEPTNLVIDDFLCKKLIDASLPCNVHRKAPACCTKIGSPYNQIYLPTCADKKGYAITPKYKMVYDLRDNIDPNFKLTYLKLRRSRFGYEYYRVKKMIFPAAYRELLVSVVGLKDSVFIIDSSSTQRFLEDESKWISAFNVKNDTSNNQTNNKTAEESKSDKSNPQEKIDQFIFFKISNALSSLVPIDIKALPTEQKFYSLSPYGLNISKASIKLMIKNSGEKKRIDTLLNAYIDILTELKKIDSIYKKTNDSSYAAIDTLKNKILSLTKQIENLPNIIELKTKLLSLEIALEKFNFQYSSIDFLEKKYNDDLFCLILNIKNSLSIPVPLKGSEFTKLLVNLVKSNTTEADSIYFTDFTNLILAIQANFDNALNKKAKYGIHSKPIQIPDADDLAIKIKYSNSSSYLLERNLHVSLGWKIDFSTGLFISGLKDQNYIFIDSTVKYRPDTTANTNPSQYLLRDTTGKIAIREHDGKSKLGLAVMLHAYPRFSANYNLGITAGIAANTTGDFNFLLGLGLMLGSQKRIVLSGGLIWGKINTKSISVSTGVNRLNPYNDPTLNRYSKPIFYSTVDGKVPVVSGWHNSWFFGFSYNLSNK